MPFAAEVLEPTREVVKTSGRKVTLLQLNIPFAESKGAEFRAGADVSHIEPDGTGYIAN